MKPSLNPQQIIELLSWRHHYIPIFLIKGFTDKDGKLYVYDKNQDRILAKRLTPSMVFFDRDRNTIEIAPGRRSSFLEEGYSHLDNRASKAIKYFQETPL